jgi:hypothetical protein
LALTDAVPPPVALDLAACYTLNIVSIWLDATGQLLSAKGWRFEPSRLRATAGLTRNA